MARRLLDMPLARWAAAATAAGSITFSIDRWRVFILSRGHARLRWVQELTLWSGHVLLAISLVLLGVLGIVVAARAFRRASRPTSRFSSARLQLGLASLVVYLPLVWPLSSAGSMLASGPWVSEQAFAPLVRWGPLAFGVGAVPVVLLLATIQLPSRRREALLIGLGACAIAVTALLDHEVSPGLYTEFHLLMQASTTIAAVITSGRCLAVYWRPDARWTRVVVRVAAVACIAAPVFWFGMAPSTRSALVLRSPVARDWIRTVLPQPPSTRLRDVLAELDPAEGRYSAAQEAFDTSAFPRDAGWNIILVVADTLRADALPPARPSEGTRFAQTGDTPRLDAWMQGAYRFGYAYSAATETKRAMPSMFRSIEASDDPIATGVPLGSRMESLGLEPVAVVHGYFMPPKFPAVAALLDGFAAIRVYENPTTDTAIPQALDLAATLSARQFFMFVHLYTVHVPGFAGRVLTRDDGSRVENYVKSLQYLDSQFGALLDGLDELGLRERTIVVFIADHGEGLGDHGQLLHGPTTYEEDVRIPLAFEIPGHGGRQIDETVGAIDLAPTLVDLLGARGDPGDRGRSLVPLFIQDPREPERPYYFENSDATTMGVVVGHDKLIYEKGIDIAFRFDVLADPDERDDVHDPAGKIDRTLLSNLVQFKPEIAATELEQPRTSELLRQRLNAIDPQAPGSALPLLVRLVALEPDEDLVRQCVAIFEETPDATVRLLLARHLLDRATESMTPLMVSWLAELERTPDEELEVVTALARQGQGSFAPAEIAARMDHFAKLGTPPEWDPWLRLIRGWPKPAELFARPLSGMLARTSGVADISVPTLVVLLEAAGGLEGTSVHIGTVVASARGLLAHIEPRVRAAAVRTLGALGTRADARALRALLVAESEDIRVRREAAAALTALLGDGALDDLDGVAREVAMTTVVVRHLRDKGNVNAIGILKRIAKQGVNADTRTEARRAIEAIEAREAEAPTPPPTLEKRKPKVKKPKTKKAGTKGLVPTPPPPPPGSGG